MLVEIEEYISTIRPDQDGRKLNPQEYSGILSEYLGQREQRLNNLFHFLSENAVSFESNLTSVPEVANFFTQNVCGDQSGVEISASWVPFIWDASLFIGDLLISESAGRKLNWIVKDVSIPRISLAPRLRFCVSGYVAKEQSISPEEMFLAAGRAKVLKEEGFESWGHDLILWHRNLLHL